MATAAEAAASFICRGNVPRVGRDGRMPPDEKRVGRYIGQRTTRVAGSIVQLIETELQPLCIPPLRAGGRKAFAKVDQQAGADGCDHHRWLEQALHLYSRPLGIIKEKCRCLCIAGGRSDVAGPKAVTAATVRRQQQSGQQMTCVRDAGSSR